MQRTMTQAGEEDSEPGGKLQRLSTDYKVIASNEEGECTVRSEKLQRSEMVWVARRLKSDGLSSHKEDTDQGTYTQRRGGYSCDHR